MKTIDTLIIGAGAAGLMCAIEAGKRERSVVVIDSANKAGKKILMSGGGRCNFTNTQVSHENFLSHNIQFCRSALSRYTPDHFIDLVNKHNIPFHEKTLGQLFCDQKSKDILLMLLTECEQLAVNIGLNTVVNEITQQKNHRFLVSTTNGRFDCQSLVIASGGLSIPTLGSSPFGYRVAEQFDIKVWPTRAALVPFTLHKQDKERLCVLSGISVACAVRCSGQCFTENMLFTHRGLSGPAMLQISSYWSPGDMLQITMLPDINLFKLLIQEKESQPKLELRTCLNQLFPKRLVSLWLDQMPLNKSLQSLSKDQLKQIANLFQQWSIKPNGTEGYRTAEVTLGGIDCNAISSKTFEVKQTPGLFFIGEVLDVTGWLGGYNFQWAWASGFAAGQVV